MLGLLYLALATLLGDRIARRVYPFLSWPHRSSVAFLVGLLLSTWFTYLISLAFAASAAPMRYGNIAFFGTASALCWALRRPPPARLRTALPRPPGSRAWDWAAVLFFCAMATWLVYQTLSSRGSELLVNAKVHGDFGPHLAIVQNFIWGHNFPTEYPFFAGPPISYHFLFYFQVANLHDLGLALVHSLNLLSVLSLVAMLILVGALGEIAFGSRAVGRVAGVLFFFPSTIAYFTFLPAHDSLAALIEKLLHMTEYIHSGLPLENWGLWTMNVYANQRHFASAIGVLLIALIFLLDSYRSSPTPDRAADAAAPASAADSPRGSLGGFLFSGLLLGSLLLWNSPTFVSAIAVLGGFLILFPHRLKLLGLAAVAAACSLPQLLYLRHASSASDTYPRLHWGFVLDHPTLVDALAYLGGTLGVALLPIALAVALLQGFQRRLFLAMLGLLVLPFTVQFHPQIVGMNHKFINIWIILGNLFASYSLCYLWQLGRWRIAGRAAAVILFASMTLGGLINLFPIRNDSMYGIAIGDDPLIDWIRAHTLPKDVFLTHPHIHHPIHMAGRKVFFAWPVYAWSAGYPTQERHEVLTEMFESRDPERVFDLLQQNQIAYVAIDDSLRHGDFAKNLNEELYEKFFRRAFEGANQRYGSLVIYEVPSRDDWAARESREGE
ncbi:MAG TPA: hypothetical protein VEC18_11415 [Myxococcota bacterium]|nr:hypothetical protein [Myxococcota bacterium]